MTDAELVAGHLAGDRGALAAIYDRYADSLHDTAAAMTRQRHDAADVLQDVFVIAAERLGQLRDPERLKPWLFAILRNEVYRRSGKKRRTVITDFTDPVVEMTAPSQPADEGTNVEFEELAELVRGAAAGLDARDQLVLELSIRQGLQGDELADALGVSPKQSYSLVHRMRQRTERSLGAYCVARAGRKDCPELAEILRDWDGEFSVLIRKRVARHVDDCETCERSRRTLAPFALFGAAPVMAAPAELRDRVLAAAGQPHATPAYGFGAPGGFPSLVQVGRRLGLWLFLTGSMLFLALGARVYVLADDEPSLVIHAGSTTTIAGDDTTTTVTGDGGADPTVPVVPADEPAEADPSSTETTTSTTPTTTSATTTSTTGSPTGEATTTTVAASPPATTPTPTQPESTTTAPSTTTTPAPTLPGSLTVSTEAIHFGTTIDSARVTLTNTGDAAVDWSASSGPIALRGPASPFSVSPSAGNLAGSDSVDVTVSIDRTWPAEGPVPAEQITFVAAGTSASMTLTGEIAHPPVVRIVAGPPTMLCYKDTGSASFGGFFWEIAIADESTPVRATLLVSTPRGSTLTDVFDEDVGHWFAGVSPDFSSRTDSIGVYEWRVQAFDALGYGTTVNGSVSVGTDSAHC